MWNGIPQPISQQESYPSLNHHPLPCEQMVIYRKNATFTRPFGGGKKKVTENGGLYVMFLAPS